MALKVKDRESSLLKFNRALPVEVSERKKTENLLRESEQRYRLLNENIPVGVFRTKPNGKIISFNPAILKMLGLTNELEINILQANDFYNREGDRQHMLDEIARNSQINGFECQLKSIKGDKLWVSISAIGIKDENGRIKYIDGIIEDITERRASEREKAWLQKQLIQAQKMEAVGTLAGGIAHDFNNILQAIFGYAQMAKDNSVENPKVQKYINQLITASERAKELVHQILAFSRQGEVEKKPIEIGGIIKGALKLIRASIPSTIEIRQNLEPNIGAIVADETQVFQLVMNLCTNAFHAMEKEGGQLDIDLFPVRISTEDFLGYQDIQPGEYLQLSVSDTGHGMSPDRLSRIFEPYFTTKDVGEGTGLGLAMVHGIVKSCRGSIKVFSKPNKGTIFSVVFPIAESKVEKPLELSTPLPKGIEQILFVDDEKILVDIGKESLEGLGYKVEARTSSYDALEVFRIQPDKFDIIITDMTMPKMTGEKLAAEIQKIRSDIPIVLCTGYSSSINRENALSTGISDMLMKPITLNDMANTVRRVLDDAKKTSQA